ncbi:long-chain fatty acid--CoA ligase [Saccharopolyspora rhizosphaerae]|uniref:Acyl-CoA synthetase n=1 Tax=Saccharopolyspora rhizosphaerae TaxID=2492662 RepID=A0A3R8NVQ3_9PSEU|nr:long-chain fatty acid--CoA ligase [Saccharopolyspora rhizosphaerae]RRO14269.1 long-chain fatty acid--CoA ligase [Saccharopolyspora rhizosphaerae]
MPAAITSDFRSVPDMLRDRVQRSGDSEAFRYPDGDQWRSLTWSQTWERARAIALGLHAIGLRSQQRCGILASTRIEWILADMGVMCAGGATTTIYPTTTAEGCAYIIADSDSTIVFAEDDEQIAKLREQRAHLPDLARVITFDGTPDGDWVLSLSDLEAKGRELGEAQPDLFDSLVDAVDTEDLATLIYTSGTTGNPKGVRLAQANWTYVAEAMHETGEMTAEDVQYLWLPLSHVFGKVLQVGQIRTGYLTAVDGRIDKIVDNLAEVRPTFVAGAPRIFEKIYNKVVMQAKEGGELKYTIFRWACAVGLEISHLQQEGKHPGLALKVQHAIADKLVFAKLREKFGGRLRFFISGSAALAPDIARFFHAAGVLIAEGYGLTETTAASFVNRTNDFRIGTVGQPLPGTEVRIAEDGEVLLRGGGVMRGYHNMPEATAEVLDADGWFHTGDIGELDEAGRLRITDRKKDLIKTSGGKYVAPQSVEGKLKAQCPYLSNVVVFGDKQPYCSALVTLDEESIAEWARANDLGSLSYAELAEHPKTHELVGAAIEDLNATLNRHETIKTFKVLPRELSIEHNEVTPSLKIKRKAVADNHREVLEELYPSTVESL